MFNLCMLLSCLIATPCTAQVFRSAQPCSDVCAIESDIEQLEKLTATISSSIDQIDQDIPAICSKTEIVDSKLEAAASLIDTVGGDIEASAIEQTAATISSKLDPIASKVEIADDCSCNIGPCGVCAISADDIGSSGFTISRSGSYYLATFVNANTGSNPAITIDADDVVLDMNNNTIRRTSDGNTIEVAANHTNIVIKDGFVRNVGAGLRGIMVREGCRNVSLHEMWAIGRGTGTEGVAFEQNCHDVFINECSFVNSGTHALVVNDATGTACSNFTIQESNFNENGGNGIKINNTQKVTCDWLALSENSIDGLRFDTVTEFSIANCHVTQNTQNGLHFISSSVGNIEDNVIQANGGSSTGIQLEQTTGLFIARNVSGSNDVGLHADANSPDNNIEDNAFIVNSTVNVDNDALNSYVGNFALNGMAANNYTGSVTGFFNSNTILTASQGTAFSATPQHARWYNISLST